MYYDDRHRYPGEHYYPGHDPFDSPPRITHIHTNVLYGGPPRDMDIAKTFDHEPFRHTDPKYKCLCNKMHVKQGCKCILAFLVIVAVIVALLLILNWNIGTWTTLIIHAILLLGIIACAVALLIAMKTEKEKLLLPVAAIAVLGAIISIIFLAFTIWSLIDPSGVTGQLVNNFVVSQNASQTDDQGLAENREGDVSATIGKSILANGLADNLASNQDIQSVLVSIDRSQKGSSCPNNQNHISVRSNTANKPVTGSKPISYYIDEVGSVEICQLILERTGYLALKPSYQPSRPFANIETISAITIVIALAALAASIWVAFVVYKYYMYLKDMKFARVPKNQVHIEITDLKKGIKQ